MPKNFAQAFATALTAGGTRKAVTAAARTSPVGDAAKRKIGQKNGTGDQEWQQRAWEYFDTVGEVHYSSSFVGACLSRCRLTIGIPDDDGHVGPVFDEDGNIKDDDDGGEALGNSRDLSSAPEALRLVRALQSDTGGQSELLRAMGLNLRVAGEGTLVGTPREDRAGLDNSKLPLTELQWEFLSTDEFKVNGDDYKRVRGPGFSTEEISGQSVFAVRIWQAHPRFSEMPDSGLRAVLPICEELSLLTREIKGDIHSRLANAGLYWVPNEIDYPEPADFDPDEDGDAFTADLIATMSTAITDKESAAGTVPMVVRAPAQYIKDVRHDQFPIQSNNTIERRRDAVLRFAQGVDLPVEIVTGQGDTTFANAVVIDDALFKAHIEPVLEMICSALTSGFLRSALGDDCPFVVHYDASELLSRPNRAQDAKDAYDRDAIGAAPLRNALGFSDSDAPTEEELAAKTTRKAATTPGQVPTSQPTPAPEDAQDGPGSNAPGSEVEQGTDDPGASLQAAVLMATEYAVERAIRRAGARLRSKASRLPAHKELLSQVPDAEVAVTLGQTTVERLGGVDSLFVGEFDTLDTFVRRHTGDATLARTLVAQANDIARARVWKPTSTFPEFALAS